MILSVALVMLGLPSVARAQGLALAVSKESGPAGSRVTVTGTGWPLQYYPNGVQVGFYQNFGNGVLTPYADPIVVKQDENENFRFETSIPTSFKPGDIVSFSALIGNGSGARANFTVTSGSDSVTVDRTYLANSAWAESSRVEPGDLVRYQVVLKASADTVVNVKVRVVGPAGRVLFDSGGDVTVTPRAGSVFYESTIPKDAPAGTYMQVATVTHAGATTGRASSFSIGGGVAFGPPEWLAKLLTDQDLFSCTISMTSLAALMVSAPASSTPAMLKAVEALDRIGTVQAFFEALEGDDYFKIALRFANNTIYEPFRTCFAGMQNAMQLTAGDAGRMVGQWLREVLVNNKKG